MLGKLAAASDSCLALLQRNLSFFLVFPSTQNSPLNQTLDVCLSVSFQRYQISTFSKEELYLKPKRSRWKFT